MPAMMMMKSGVAELKNGLAVGQICSFFLPMFPCLACLAYGGGVCADVPWSWAVVVVGWKL
jgi:hypothetical protein